MGILIMKWCRGNRWIHIICCVGIKWHIIQGTAPYKPILPHLPFSHTQHKTMPPTLKTLLFLLFTCLHNHHITIQASDPDPIQDYCIPNPIKSPSHLSILPCKNSTNVTTDDFVFSGLKLPGNFTKTGLATIPVNPTTFPGLNTLGMSFVRADLKPGAVNPPHFHPRATEITYVLHGTVYSGFVDSTNTVFARVLEEGEVMVFPRGLMHFQMNVGKRHATVFGCFNSQNPGNQKIPSAIFGSGIDDRLLEKAFGLSPKQIGTMRRKFDPQTMWCDVMWSKQKFLY